MTKFIAAFLSVLLALYSGIIGTGKNIQAFFDKSGTPWCMAGRAIAEHIRNVEAKKKQYPDKSDFCKKEFINDMGDDFVTDPEMTLTAETWVAKEITLESEKSYADPFNDVDVDLILVGNGLKYTVPGFWDGGNTWKIRFVCPSEGEWLFKTVCTDSENEALDGRTGKVICSVYGGEYEIYRHGFVTNAHNQKYFTYDDGTPFFYLGDTHWSLGDETPEMVEAISSKREQQGFTVMQSEPIGAKFCVENGITADDMAGFADYDEKFRIIANHGLVHANAEFFFPPYMQVLIDYYGGFENGEICEKAKKYLEKLSRCWVARYSAYPVLWTLGQEVDNDFYLPEGQAWNSENNPYKLVAEYIYKYDAYSHPITAHQENSGSTGAYGSGAGLDENLKSYLKTDPSAFRNVRAHSWYAAQWSPSLTGRSDYKREKDYWYNSQGKPVINYEGRYCYLWTKNFGSRMQGWASYLSGMFGYGWGAHDTWSYLNIYDEENNSSDGIDTVTSSEKINATWQDALEYPCSYQVGYMKNFFTSFDWWNLIPRFDNSLYFAPSAGVYCYNASNADNSEIVIYFYSFSDKSIGEKPNSNELSGALTGRVGSLEPSAEYKYKWFDPVSGEFSAEESFISTPFGTYEIGEKKFNGETVSGDMAIYIYKGEA